MSWTGQAQAYPFRGAGVLVSLSSFGADQIANLAVRFEFVQRD